ncbi:GAF domain-containing protein [candidate division KSB1 bacterium]|nr:GAF domain-containing protein [candidate division KSB1 bacterium]
MSFFTLLPILGFGFGTALTLILLGLSLKKAPKRYDDFAFGVVLFSCALWNAGNFLSLLFWLFFGSVAALTAAVFKLIAYLGLVVMPSALLHVHLAIRFRTESSQEETLNSRRQLSIVLLYVPAFLFVLSAFLWRPLPAPELVVARVFILWALTAIAGSLWISRRFIPLLSDPSDRHFYRDLGQILAGIAVGSLLIFVVPLYRVHYIGETLALILLLSPAYPMAVLAYYIYRYNFYRLVIKPSLVYSIIYGLVMAIYLLGIRRLGDYLGRFPEVNSAVIEGLLLVALVFAFQPFRARVQDRLDKWFFKERYYYQQVLRELSDSISRIFDLDQLMNTLSETLVTVFKAKSCAILVFRFDDGKPVILHESGTRVLPHVTLLVQALQETRHFSLRRQMRDHRVIWALQKNKMALAVPIAFENLLTGLICLSERQNGNDYTDEEMDVLQTFANQVALAFQYARLLQERLELESHIYQSENLRNMGQLATTIAHEIKNPLSSIKVLIQVLSENAVGRDKQDLNRVISEINRLNAVLEKLLSFARPTQANRERLDVGEVVEDVIALLRHQAEQNRVRIDFEPPTCACRVLAPKQSVREIIFNLLHNALQAMPMGGRVRVILTSSKSDGAAGGESWVEIRIADNGPGIDAETQGKIFSPFFTTKAVGTGLGLTIVRRNVRDLGGRLELESQVGQGSEFRVTLRGAEAKRKARESE